MKRLARDKRSSLFIMNISNNRLCSNAFSDLQILDLDEKACQAQSLCYLS
jgi:hypothetical protein